MLAYTLVFAAICVFLAGCWRLYVWIMDADDHRDPFAQSSLTVDAGTVTDLGPMPPEIAHDGPPWPVLTSPATHPAPPASQADYTGAETHPGTAAAAGGSPPPATPPPLPELHRAAQAATERPGSEPFAVWELDEFVEVYNAIQGGA